MASVLEQEIMAQPEAVAAFLDRQRDKVRDITAALPAFSYVLVAARGSSDHAAVYAQYVWGWLARTSVALATPSLYTLYQAPPRLSDALVVAISQSGQSPDVLAVAQEARSQGRPVIAITNDPDSPLGRTSEFIIELGTTERSIAATKTYTCQLAAIALLAVAWTKDRERQEALWRLPEAMAKTLACSAGPAARAAYEVKDAPTLLSLARGVNLCTAHEIALKLREVLCMNTYGFSAADFRHGSHALLEQGIPCTLVMPSGVAFDDMADLARKLVTKKGSILAISDDPRAVSLAQVTLPLCPVSEWLTPLTAILPAQCLALELARARGLDPDNPRGLETKIVKTL
jgi:glucosamine--fructose-6-phosphate aminotransferase (isomerizing)